LEQPIGERRRDRHGSSAGTLVLPLRTDRIINRIVALQAGASSPDRSTIVTRQRVGRPYHLRVNSEFSRDAAKGVIAQWPHPKKTEKPTESADNVEDNGHHRSVVNRRKPANATALTTIGLVD
jgi:hypothetical protein